MDSFIENIKKPKVFIPIIAGVLLIITAISFMSWRVDVRNDGEAKQETVERTHQNAQNSLSTCLDQGRTAAQVTEQEFKQLKEILVEVTSARYVDAEGDPTNASEAIGGGQLFSVVQEAYPDIDQSSFQNLQEVVVGCRDAYQNAQDRLFAQIEDFDTWIQTGSLWSQGIHSSFPTDDLEVVNAATNEILREQAALDYMSRVIQVEDARQAYADGELPEQDLFNEDGGN